MFVKEYRDREFDFPDYGKKAFGVRALTTTDEIIRSFKKDGAIVPSAIMYMISFRYEDLSHSKLAQKKEALKKLLQTAKIHRDGKMVTLEAEEDEDTIYSGAVELFQFKDKKTYQLFLNVEHSDQKLMLLLAAVCQNLLDEFQFGPGCKCITLSANRLLLRGLHDILSGQKEEWILCDGMCFKERLDDVSDPADTDPDGLAEIILEEDLGRMGFLPARLITRMFHCEELAESEHEILADLASTVDSLDPEPGDGSLLFRLLDKALDIPDTEDVLQPSDAERDYGFTLVDIRQDADTWEAFAPLFPSRIHYRDYPGQLMGAVDSSGMAVGAMAVTAEDLCLTVDYLYVPQDRRRQGIGSFLVSALVALAEDLRDPKEIRAQFSTDNLELMYFFYHLRAFTFVSSDAEYYISPASIADNKWMRKLSGMPADIQRYQQLPAGLKRELIQTLEENGLIHMIDPQDFEADLIDDLSPVKIIDGTIAGTILTKRSDANDRTLELLVIYSKNQQTTTELLSGVSAAMLEKYAGYGFVTKPINERSRKLLFKLFEEPEVIRYKTVAASNELPF